MKQKTVSVVIYAITALALAYYFDSLYGAGPVARHLELIHTAIAGAILFVVACVLSVFSLRFGTVCALAACVLWWPFFSSNLFAILSVWRSLFSILHHSNWEASLQSVLMLIISSIYSLSRLRLLLRAPREVN